MRLTCPNCGAQYEVPDDAIPESGRDLQCSNCGHVWFEQPGQVADEAPAETGDAGEPEAETTPAKDDVAETVTDTGTDAGTVTGTDTVTGTEEAEAPEPVEPRTVRPRTRKSLDPTVEAILREEAERERAAREAESLESQGELGLSDMSPRPPRETETPTGPALAAYVEGDADPDVTPRAAPRRPERAPPPAGTEGPEDESGSAADEPEAEPDPKRAEVHDISRRDQLPDIEEINSSLDPKAAEAQKAREATDGKEQRGRGFRMGFGLVLLVASALTFLYLGADEIGEAVPNTAPTMTAYKDAVDEGRLWLDLTLQSLVDGAEAVTQPEADTATEGE